MIPHHVRLTPVNGHMQVMRTAYLKYGQVTWSKCMSCVDSALWDTTCNCQHCQSWGTEWSVDSCPVALCVTLRVGCGCHCWSKQFHLRDQGRPLCQYWDLMPRARKRPWTLELWYRLEGGLWLRICPYIIIICSSWPDVWGTCPILQQVCSWLVLLHEPPSYGWDITHVVNGTLHTKLRCGMYICMHMHTAHNELSWHFHIVAWTGCRWQCCDVECCGSEMAIQHPASQCV